MAIAFPSGSVSRSTSAEYTWNGASSIAGWLWVPDSAIGTNVGCLGIGTQGDWNDADWIVIKSSTSKLRLGAYKSGAGSEASSSSDVATSTWMHIAVARTSATNSDLYINGVKEATNTYDVTGRTSAGSFVIEFGQGGGIGAGGCQTHGWIAWNRALGVDEIKSQMLRTQPIDRTSIHGVWPFLRGQRTADFSGLAHTLTEGGSPTDADPPSVAWGSGIGVVNIPVASGNIAATITAAATITGAIAARADVAATISATGTVTGAIAARGDLAASVTATATVAGTISARGDLAAAITATVTLTGTISANAAMAAAMTGTITVTGAITARADVAAAIACAGALVGAISARGDLAAALTGTVTMTADLTPLTDGTMAAALTASVALSGAISARADLHGAFTATGTLVASVSDASAPVISVITWSDTPTLVAGDEILLTLTGPSCDNARVRIMMHLRTLP